MVFCSSVKNFIHFPKLIGHRLERDVETGGLQTKHHRRAKEVERNCAERGLDSLSHHNLVTTPTSSEMVTPTTPGGK